MIEVEEIFIALCTALTVTILVLFGVMVFLMVDIKSRIKAKENRNVRHN
jgi:hypothetical protein